MLADLKFQTGAPNGICYVVAKNACSLVVVLSCPCCQAVFGKYGSAVAHVGRHVKDGAVHSGQRRSRWQWTAPGLAALLRQLDGATAAALTSADWLSASQVAIVGSDESIFAVDGHRLAVPSVAEISKAAGCLLGTAVTDVKGTCSLAGAVVLPVGAALPAVASAAYWRSRQTAAAAVVSAVGAEREVMTVVTTAGEVAHAGESPV